MPQFYLFEKIRTFYNLRARIIFSFTLLSVICVFIYGLLSSFIYEVVNDQLFNWYISETSIEIKENNEYPKDTKFRSLVLGEDQDLYNHLAQKYIIAEPFDNQNFETMKILEVKEVMGNKIIYEIVIDGKKLHVVSIPREKQRQFLIYNVSGFLEHREASEHINDRHVLWLTLPLALIVIIIAVFLGVLLSKHVISPLSVLAETVRDIDPEGPVPNIPSKYNVDEVGMLAKTIENMMIKINQFVEHERRFSREVSHELRTPVTSISIATDLLNASHLSPQQQRVVDRISRASQDMSTLITTFVMLGKDIIEKDQKVFIPMKQCILSIVGKNLYLINKKPIEVTIDIAESEELLANESLFNVIMSNLIRNSFQYTHRGHIVISGDHQKIKVSDTGLGISKKDIELIGSAYSAFQESGTGLGLSIVKRITQKIDWKVQIESQENNGTTVIITPL